MDLSAIAQGAKLLLNPQADRAAAYGERQRAVLAPEDWAEARTTISGWPGYGPTPLVPLPGLTRALDIGELAYKDEAGRFGLGSFKALGGAYAVARLLQRQVAMHRGVETVGLDSILAGEHAAIVSAVTVCCATDGNHGRSVAWGARTFGCRCVIFIHETVSEGRKAAIERFGAEVRRVPGNYDESVRLAQETADHEGWFVVSDTSYEGYMEVPREVMQGYTVMADEVLGQWQGAGPTHVFLQTGVGGMAAAVWARFWVARDVDSNSERPRCVLVDPESAACWYESLAADRPVAIEGDLETVMAGLSCGEISLLAWDVLETGADAVMTVSDAAATGCMRLLADGVGGDAPLVAGESAVAGLAGLIGAACDPELRARLGLTSESRVLLFGTEGATDPEVYQEIVGRSAEAVAAGPAG